MQSHRRPRGRIFFEVVCALAVGASFVGAWIQTGAWALIGPAFVFTLFGLYWSFDMFGDRTPVLAVDAVPEVERATEPDIEPDSAVMPEIRFQRFEAMAEASTRPDPRPEPEPEPEPEPDPVMARIQAEPEIAAPTEPKAKIRKTRAKKTAASEPPQSPVEEPPYEQHIEQLFDPQPFARQARPAFGKRPRGPGSRPLPV